MKKTFSRRNAAIIAAALVALAGCGGGSSQTSFSLGGTVTGLTGGTLQLSDGTSLLNLTGDGTFVFPLRLGTGASYGVFVQAQPAGLTCRVTNASGSISSSDISDVQVTCVPNRALGGTVVGLTSAGLVLVNGNDKTTVNGSAATAAGIPFSLSKVGSGFAYGVTILQQPAPQTCVVQQGAGIANADVNNVQVVCQ